MTIVLYIILGIIAALILWVIYAYNFFVRLVNRTKEAWADIDVQLRRRYDLIPNLVETVKGYAKHERQTFDAVVNARAKATQMTIDPSTVTPEQIKAFGEAQMGLSTALGRLLAVAENYPDLKANQNFLQLQNRVSGLENTISDRREFFNESANVYNIRIQQFPDVFLANSLGYKQHPLLEIPKEETKDVKINF